jgi:hypothetical protein
MRHVIEQVRVRARSLGACAAAARLGHKRLISDLENGAAEAQHVTLVDESFRRTEAHGLAVEVCDRDRLQDLGLQVRRPERHKFGRRSGQLAGIESLTRLADEVEQLHRLVDVGAAFVDPLGDVLGGQAHGFAQAVVTLGFFHRMQVAPLQVLDQLQLQHLAICQLTDQHRHEAQAGLSRWRANAARRRRSHA